GEVVKRINDLQATVRDEALNDADIAGPDFRPAEQPVFAAQGNGANLPLQVVSVERDIGVFEKDAQGVLPLQRIASRFGKGIGRQQHVRAQRGSKPGKERLHYGLGVLGAEVELGGVLQPACTDRGLVLIEEADEV